jgi:predicted nucleic acid-binding protein
MANLTKLPRGVSVFVDANILVYYFTQMPPLTEVCEAFFERVSRLLRPVCTSWT